MEHLRLIIIGAGPAGYTAAIYALRSGLRPLLIEGTLPGGQLTQTTLVGNYPGFPEGVEGFDLMDNMREQAERLGLTTRSATCLRTDLSARPLRLWLDDGGELSADSLIIATGASPRYLGIEGESRLRGKGVSACATCDGFFYRGKTVAVVGGGDTACEEASYLSGLAAKVYVIVRKPFLRATQIMQQRIFENPKIEVLFEHNTLELLGEERLTEARLVHRKGEKDERQYTLPLDGFFLAIGHKPNSDPFKPWLPTTEEGYIQTEWGTTRTSLPGVFAAGDVADPHYRQAVIAASSGAIAAIEAERYLNSL